MPPPYKITKKSLKLIVDISNLIGRYEGIHSPVPTPQLRKQNKIKTIYGTLAIEGNTLTIEQITAIIENKRVIGQKKDIIEVNNAIKAYQDLSLFNQHSLESLCKAHKIFMQSLVKDAGQIRAGNVGIFKGGKVSHVAPQPKMLPRLLKNLFEFFKKSDEHKIIKSCVFHYEFEFIHPFSDGNGRLGRFWQSVILYNYNNIFEYIPIESLIKENQKDYYKVLEQCDKEGESTKFIEFILEIIFRGLKDFLENIKTSPIDIEVRIAKAKEYFRIKTFTRKDYLNLFKTISTATASRDLQHYVKNKMLKRSGDKRLTVYKFNL